MSELVNEADRKRQSHLQAIAALKGGVRVDPFNTDSGQRAWLITRWHLTKQANSLDEVEAFLAQMGIHA